MGTAPASGRFAFSDVNSVPMTLQITMPVKSWRQLQTTLKDTNFAANDGWYFYHQVLTDLLLKADTSLWSLADEREAGAP
jgi:hypothetical protein